MKQKHFITELKMPLEMLDFSIIRNLYQPIIGTESVALYGLLSDYHEMAKYKKTFYSFQELIKNLKISLNDFELARKKLESVGLIRTYEKADEKHFIIIINKPMRAHTFRKNSLLYKMLINQIGELAFERFEFSTKEDKLSKDEYEEITIKFTDIFELPSTNTQNTLEFEIPKNLNKDKAIKSLAPLQFAGYLENKKPSPSFLVLAQEMQNSGLSTESINTIFDYSFNVNGKIVQEHVRVIFKDLIKKNVKSCEEIKTELKTAFDNRNSHYGSKNLKTINEAETQKDMDELDSSWEEIFNSLGEF